MSSGGYCFPPTVIERKGKRDQLAASPPPATVAAMLCFPERQNDGCLARGMTGDARDARPVAEVLLRRQCHPELVEEEGDVVGRLVDADRQRAADAVAGQAVDGQVERATRRRGLLQASDHLS